MLLFWIRFFNILQPQELWKPSSSPFFSDLSLSSFHFLNSIFQDLFLLPLNLLFLPISHPASILSQIEARFSCDRISSCLNLRRYARAFQWERCACLMRWMIATLHRSITKLSSQLNSNGKSNGKPALVCWFPSQPLSIEAKKMEKKETWY